MQRCSTIIIQYVHVMFLAAKLLYNKLNYVERKCTHVYCYVSYIWYMDKLVSRAGFGNQ